MSNKLTPDFVFNNIFEITPQFLRGLEIEALILDIDNTLVPYEIPEPTDELRAWFSALGENSIAAALVSNNGRKRVELFNRSLGLPMFAKSGKPSRKNLRRAMEEMGARPENTAMIGDQIFTDVFAGKRLGLRAILVPPIKDKRDPFTKFKRLLERPILHAYKARQNRSRRA